MDHQLSVLRAANFDYAQHLDNIWKDSPYHLKDLNQHVLDELLDDLSQHTHDRCTPSPLGWVIAGQAGTGKTHLLGVLRREIWAAGGWFILFDLLDVKDFWLIAALSYLHSLQQRMPDGRLQSEAILAKLIDVATDGRAPQVPATVLAGADPDELIKLADRLVSVLNDKYVAEIRSHKHVLRALILLHSRDPLIADNAFHWLQAIEIDEEFTEEFGLRHSQHTPRDIVQGLSWLMSLTGPTVLAVDQIDAIISEQHLASGCTGEAATPQQQKALSIIEGLGRGLMDLRDVTRRTLTVISCVEGSWQILSERTVRAVRGRFHDEPIFLQPVRDAKIAAALVEKRLMPTGARVNFSPAYPTWPFRPEAFQSAVGLFPRELLKLCDGHRRRCLRDQKVSELRSFSGDSSDDTSVPPSLGEIDKIERRFDQLKATADVRAPMNTEAESSAFCQLLQSVMRCYALQTCLCFGKYELAIDNDFKGDRPPLHTRLRMIDRSRGDRELHYCFRAVTSRNPIAFQTRLRAAMTASGIDRDISFRRLFVLRRPALPAGRKTSEIIKEFQANQGVFVEAKEQDLRVFSALQVLERERAEGFEDWLRSRKPLDETHLFQTVGLVPAGASNQGDGKTIRPGQGTSGDFSSDPELPFDQPGEDRGRKGSAAAQKVFVGRRVSDNTPVLLDLFSLNRHTAILAGSGSGKSVALRRIVEEAALLGVPSIVLDPNNDLARLGQPWPEAPKDWNASEAAKSRAYHKNVEVVIWTPLLSRGNPLTLAPVPDFNAIKDEPDELRKAVLMVTSALKPHAIPGGVGQAAKLREGILTSALEYFALNGAGSLDDFIALLSELPYDAGAGITDAAGHAQKMADQLRSAIAINPLLATRGQVLDPATLLTSSSGKMRVSVINFSGLPSDEQKQSFVNQLAMILFTWIKKRPASVARPLQGLLVVDEAQNFVPSQRSVASKSSMISLTQQGRKYGLGLIFATQAPKGIDHQIILNCTTQMIGKANSPTAIDAAQELLKNKGGGGDDVARLERGQFYLHTEGFPKPVKIQTPLCLSHHPATPPSEEEVVVLAQQSRQAGGAS